VNCSLRKYCDAWKFNAHVIESAPNKGSVPNNQVYCIDTIILAATKARKLIKGAAAEFEANSPISANEANRHFTLRAFCKAASDYLSGGKSASLC
jgi:hypothetical protein